MELELLKHKVELFLHFQIRKSDQISTSSESVSLDQKICSIFVSENLI